MAHSGFEGSVEKSVPPAITDKIAVDHFAETGFLPFDFAIANARHGVTPEAAIDT